MKDIHITFTWHHNNRPDDAPVLGCLTIPVNDYLVDQLQNIQEFPPILATQVSSNFRCITEMISWYAILNLMYILGDDKILSIKPA